MLSTKDNESGKGLSLLAGAATFAAYFFFARPQMLKWGTNLGESQRRLPGDELVPSPSLNTTHAINIDAPPEAVWPWLAQMGREKTGYYSFDTWTNQGIPSVGTIRKDLPAPEVGMALEGGFQIMNVEPNRALLFGGFGMTRFLGVVLDQSILYLLERRRDGSTRLLVRQRGYSYGPFSPIFNLLFEVSYFLFIQQQFAAIKQQAESMAHLK